MEAAIGAVGSQPKQVQQGEYKSEHRKNSRPCRLSDTKS